MAARKQNGVKRRFGMQSDELNGNRSLAEEVTRILRTRILQGEYEIGEKLTESKIAAEMKVSRTPIRDAFRELEKEQLVEYVPNKGCFAKGFSKEDMRDIYAVRKAVEQLAIRQVIDHADEDSLRELSEQLDRMRLYTEQNSYDKLLQANEEFHFMIYRMTGSRFIIRIMRTYQEYVHLARRETLKKDEDLPQIYREHEAIYRAIAARDADAAVEAAGQHLDASARRAMERWTDKEQR